MLLVALQVIPSPPSSRSLCVISSSRLFVARTPLLLRPLLLRPLPRLPQGCQRSPYANLLVIHWPPLPARMFPFRVRLVSGQPVPPLSAELLLPGSEPSSNGLRRSLSDLPALSSNVQPVAPRVKRTLGLLTCLPLKVCGARIGPRILVLGPTGVSPTVNGLGPTGEPRR